MIQNVYRRSLNPARPPFHEARYLLAEEPDLRDAALCHSVLAAVAEGNASRGGMRRARRSRSGSSAPRGRCFGVRLTWSGSGRWPRRPGRRRRRGPLRSTARRWCRSSRR
ncbi:hypothetical protein GUY59_14855 [Nonomuraea sp. K271]|nr:hypothetical protein [Nonomuraea sp. K271]